MTNGAFRVTRSLFRGWPDRPHGIGGSAPVAHIQFLRYPAPRHRRSLTAIRPSGWSIRPSGSHLYFSTFAFELWPFSDAIPKFVPLTGRSGPAPGLRPPTPFPRPTAQAQPTTAAPPCAQAITPHPGPNPQAGRKTRPSPRLSTAPPPRLSRPNWGAAPGASPPSAPPDCPPPPPPAAWQTPRCPAPARRPAGPRAGPSPPGATAARCIAATPCVAPCRSVRRTNRPRALHQPAWRRKVKPNM